MYILGTSTELLLEEISRLLESFWSNYNILLLNMNKEFVSLECTKLMSFVNKAHNIVTCLKCKFESTQVLKNLCFWKQITPFLVIKH